MNITLLCSDASHPIFPMLVDWVKRNEDRHQVSIETKSRDLPGGDILFLISCHELITAAMRSRYRKTLVIHASDLPKGRGWSPHVWAVLEGQQRIVVSLLEAEDSPDTGAIWAKDGFDLSGHELWDEINAKLFDAELRLMNFAVENFATVRPEPQPATGATSYRRRTPADSRIDVSKPIIDQLALLRVSDPNRYPAYFEKDGITYELVLRKRVRSQ